MPEEKHSKFIILFIINKENLCLKRNMQVNNDYHRKGLEKEPRWP